MALKIDGKEEYAILVNENRFDGELNSRERVLQFLSNRYLIEGNKPTLKTATQSESINESFRYELTEEEKALQKKGYQVMVIIMLVFLIAMFIVILFLRP